MSNTITHLEAAQILYKAEEKNIKIMIEYEEEQAKRTLIQSEQTKQCQKRTHTTKTK